MCSGSCSSAASLAWGGRYSCRKGQRSWSPSVRKTNSFTTSISIPLAMISCLLLERRGVWRTVGVTTLLLSVILPAVSLLWTVFVPPASASVFAESAFGGALGNSIVLALGVAAVSLGIGLPLG